VLLAFYALLIWIWHSIRSEFTATGPGDRDRQGRKVAAGGGGLGLADAGAIRSPDRVSAVV
jgi:hypothetical protein